MENGLDPWGGLSVAHGKVLGILLAAAIAGVITGRRNARFRNRAWVVDSQWVVAAPGQPGLREPPCGNRLYVFWPEQCLRLRRWID